MRACVLALLFLCPVRAADPPPVAEVEFQRDIEYGQALGESLRLNLAFPKGVTRRLPLVVVIHGGAWRGGDRAGHDDLTRRLAAEGYVAATLGYRFCPKHVFPAQVEDVKCAVRFLRANAEKYRIDPERVGAVGFSAGAHLAMMLGTMDVADGLDGAGGSLGFSSKVQAVVSFFGPTDFELPVTEATRPLLVDFLGGPIGEKREAYRRASPVTYVSKGDAPMLLFQGTNDPLIPHAHATRMADALQAKGVPGRIELIVLAGHGWGGAELARTAAAMTAFLAEELRPPAAAAK